MRKKFITTMVFISIVIIVLSGCYIHRNHVEYGHRQHRHHNEEVHY